MLLVTQVVQKELFPHYAFLAIKTVSNVQAQTKTNAQVVLTHIFLT